MSGRPTGQKQPVPDFELEPGQLPTPYELLCMARHMHALTSHGDLEDLAWQLGMANANSVSHAIKNWKDGSCLPNLGITLALCVMIDRGIDCGLLLWLHWQVNSQHGNGNIQRCAKELAQAQWQKIEWDGTLITDVI
jgi:hypothetical protein